MKLFINYEEDEIYDLYEMKNIEDLREYVEKYYEVNPQSDKCMIIIRNYPGSYTGIRRSMAIAKAIGVCIKTKYNIEVELRGFNMFEYLNHINENNFFIDKYMWWQKDRVGSLTQLKEILGDKKIYIANKDTDISTKVDCSSCMIMQFINNNPHSIKLLEQIYFDKFST